MGSNDLPLLDVSRAEHDLLNPLASIAGCAETLLRWDDRVDAATRRRLTEIILRQAEGLQEIVREDASKRRNRLRSAM